jgi:hypothetical protein
MEVGGRHFDQHVSSEVRVSHGSNLKINHRSDENVLIVRVLVSLYYLYIFKTSFSFNPVQVVDMSKEKDWPACLGTLVQLRTNAAAFTTFCDRYA